MKYVPPNAGSADFPALSNIRHATPDSPSKCRIIYQGSHDIQENLKDFVNL